MKILILSDFAVINRYATCAKIIGDELKNHGYEIAFRCINNSLKENTMDGTNFVLQFIENVSNCIPFHYFLDFARANGLTSGVSNYLIRLDRDTVSRGTEGKSFHNFTSIIRLPEVLANEKLKYLDHKKLNIKELNGRYVFYTMNNSYNYSITPLIIKTFLSAFDPDEPVKLVIVTDRQIDNEIIDIKKNLNKYENHDVYSKQIVIHGKLELDQRIAIHNACDTFIVSDLDRTNYLDEVYGLDKPCIHPVNSNNLEQEMMLFYNEKHNLWTFNNSTGYYSLGRHVEIIKQFLESK